MSCDFLNGSNSQGLKSVDNGSRTKRPCHDARFPQAAPTDPPTPQEEKPFWTAGVERRPPRRARHMCAWCPYTRRSFERTHGHVLYRHTGVLNAHTAPHSTTTTHTHHNTHTHQNTRHNTTTLHDHNTTRRQRETETEADRDREKEDGRGVTKENKTRQDRRRWDKTRIQEKREERREKMKERRWRRKDEIRWRIERSWRRKEEIRWRIERRWKRKEETRWKRREKIKEKMKREMERNERKMIFFQKKVSEPSNPPDELAQNVSKKKKNRRTNYSSIFPWKVQNLTVFSIKYMIRIRFFGPGELIQKYFRAARYLWVRGMSSNQERWDVWWALVHQTTQNRILTRSGLLKSGNLMKCWKQERETRAGRTIWPIVRASKFVDDNTYTLSTKNEWKGYHNKIEW